MMFLFDFRSSEDLIHRLFVCIAGVADQLQTNFAADLRNILKAVFLMNQTIDVPEEKSESPTIEYQPTEDQVIQNGMFSIALIIKVERLKFNSLKRLKS